MKIKLKLFSILLLSTLVGCERSNDDHIFTLYSNYRNNNRLHVATFDATSNSWNGNMTDKQFKKLFTDENSKECNKVAELLVKEWVNTVKNTDVKYWCEKGKYRK